MSRSDWAWLIGSSLILAGFALGLIEGWLYR